MDLLPYPHPKTSAWLYERFGRYQTRDAYERAMIPRRIELLRDVILECPRELVVCYGKDHWKHFEGIFDGTTFVNDSPFRVAQRGNMLIVLTPHFSTRYFNTDEQLARFAAVCLAPSHV